MKRVSAVLALAFALSLGAFAWNDHAQLSYLSLEREGWATGTVEAEGLDAFIQAEKAKLPALLSRQETEARRDIPLYRPLPESLAFTGQEADLRLAFLHALRVNPRVPYALFVKSEVGRARDARPDLAVDRVDIYLAKFATPPFKALSEGEGVTALEAFAAASDEPDYGIDVGLFEDNKSEVSALYGMGVQPFGNPALSYGSQAPLHMAFAHESGIIKLAASFTRTSLADWRFRTFTELARFAFAEGHPYWGWRFAGWAAHYLQDLAMPYHASMIPGKSTLQMLWLYMTGSKAQQDGEMILLSNRHCLLEDYLYGTVAHYTGDDSASPVFAALRGGKVGGRAAPSLPWRKDYLFGVVSRRAFDRGRAIDRLTVATFPAAETSDPSFDLGASGNYDIWTELQQADPAKARAYEEALAPVFQDLGVATRTFAAQFAPGK